jgi:Zn-dependent protease with chaperone function
VVTLEQIALSWFLNAAWELPVCFICCWLLVRFVPRLAAGTRYVLWLLAFGLGFLAPFGTLLGLWGDSKTIGSGFGAALPTTVNDSGAPDLLLLIFAAPALYHALLLLRGGIAASRLARRAVPVEPRILESALPRDLVVNIKRYRARIFSTGSATSACGPFTFGVRRPFILIPATLFTPPNRQMLVSVVAHELAHVQRRDMLFHLLCEIMLVPLAFHPFAYWLRSRLAEAREMACDARVSGPILSATDYARCLLDVAATLNDTASSLNALGISESATLEHRIQSLISLSSSRERKLSTWNKSCLTLAASVLFGVLFSAGRTTFLWMSAVPEPRSQREMLRVPPPPPPPPPNRR